MYLFCPNIFATIKAHFGISISKVYGCNLKVGEKGGEWGIISVDYFKQKGDLTLYLKLND